MDDNILSTIKKPLNISKDEKCFDADLLLFINSAVSNLSQLGIGPQPPLSPIVIDENSKWELFKEYVVLSQIKDYIYCFVKLSFDPPKSSNMYKALQDRKNEMEWRIREEHEYSKEIINAI